MVFHIDIEDKQFSYGPVIKLLDVLTDNLDLDTRPNQMR